MVAEGEVSPGQNERPSDDENYVTPPSSPAAKRVSLQLHQSVVQTGVLPKNISYFPSGGVAGG